MKKIIYSLVIMIAAGSLFTSCINQEEPEGLKNIRDAKAEYIRAMAELQKAKVATEAQEAAIKKAIADMKAADAAYKDEMARMKKIENDYQEALNAELLAEKKAEIEENLDAIQKRMALAEKKHEQDLLQYQHDLDSLKLVLQKEMDKLKFQNKALGEEETKAVAAAAALWYASIEAVNYQELMVMKKTYEWEKVKAEAAAAEENGQVVKTEQEKEAAKKAIVKKINDLNKKIQDFWEESRVDDLDATIEEWNQQIAVYESQMQNAKAERANFITSVAEYYANTIHDGVNDYNVSVAYKVAELKEIEDEDALAEALIAYVGSVEDKDGKPVANFTLAQLEKWSTTFKDDTNFDGDETDAIVDYVCGLAAVFAYDDPIVGVTDQIDPKFLDAEMVNDFIKGIVEKSYEWANDKSEENRRHAEIMKQATEAAALAAVKASEFEETYGGEFSVEDYETWSELKAAYEKAYKAYEEAYNEQLNAMYDELNALLAIDINDINVASYWDYKVEVARKNLEMAGKRLIALQKANEYAEKNFNKIFNYLKDSEGFEFIDLSAIVDEFDFDSIEDLIKAIENGFAPEWD